MRGVNPYMAFLKLYRASLGSNPGKPTDVAKQAGQIWRSAKDTAEKDATSEDVAKIAISKIGGYYNFPKLLNKNIKSNTLNKNIKSNTLNKNIGFIFDIIYIVISRYIGLYILFTGFVFIIFKINFVQFVFITVCFILILFCISIRFINILT